MIASGVKVMVLAIIIGIGSTIFGELSRTLTRPIDIVSAMSLLLAALSLFGLGIFGPGIAAGLVSGAPQLGAGAAAGTVAGRRSSRDRWRCAGARRFADGGGWIDGRASFRCVTCGHVGKWG